VVEGRGARVAYVAYVGETTYAQLADRVARIATIVRALGVAPDQRVLLCLHDTADFPAVLFGAIRPGIHPTLATLLADAEPLAVAADSTADDVAFWLYESGSTGAPKGAIHLLAHTAEQLYGRGVGTPVRRLSTIATRPPRRVLALQNRFRPPRSRAP
jgi:acyl-coenzyme A synthetase/AMP-(fatty) acid ligase